MYFHELVTNHSLLTMWRIVKTQTPYHMAQEIQVDEDSSVSTTRGRILLTRKSFRWRIIDDWNSLDRELRENNSLPNLKKKLKKLLIEKRPPPQGGGPKLGVKYW